MRIKVLEEKEHITKDKVYKVIFKIEKEVAIVNDIGKLIYVKDYKEMRNIVILEEEIELLTSREKSSLIKIIEKISERKANK